MHRAVHCFLILLLAVLLLRLSDSLWFAVSRFSTRVQPCFSFRTRTTCAFRTFLFVLLNEQRNSGSWKGNGVYLFLLTRRSDGVEVVCLPCFWVVLEMLLHLWVWNPKRLWDTPLPVTNNFWLKWDVRRLSQLIRRVTLHCKHSIAGLFA